MTTQKKFQFTIILSVGMLFLSCEEDNNSFNDNDGVNDGTTVEELSALPEQVNYPPNNGFSDDKFELGKSLFWDPILSGGKNVACATCHHPDFGYADGRDLSSGVGGIGLGPSRINGDLIKRNAPTIINTGFNGIDTDGEYDPLDAPMFWDNRASGLEEQAVLPIFSHDEMRGEMIAEEDIIDSLIHRLGAIPEYRNLFQRAFGSQEVTGIKIAQALATFQRTIVANNSPFDRYLRGNEQAMSNQQIQGMNTFIEVGCIDCHNGPMFSDYELHTLSVPNDPRVSDDGATGEFDFRTPTLRNLSFTAPYMHNGRFDNLREVLRFYDDISGRNGDSQNVNVDDNQIAREARELRLNNREADAIIQFLDALNDDGFDQNIPASVPSGLSIGG